MAAKNDNKESKFNKEERLIAENHMRRATKTTAIAFVFLASVTYLIFTNKIDFTQRHKIKTNDLIEFGPRFVFVLKHLTLGVSWLLFSMFYVIYKRIGTPALVPTSGHEHLVEVATNNLTNSLEQFVMSAVSQIILVIHLKPSLIVNIIPGLNILFIIGRITFWLGYPNHRAFGFWVTNFPIIVTISYNFYKLYEMYA